MKTKGLVLIMAMWLITIMSIFGLGLARITWSNYRFAKYRANTFRSLHAMKTVLELARLERASDLTPAYETATELSTDEEYIFGSLKAVYSLTDEERKINVNTAPSSVLKNLPAMNKDKAVAIVNSELKPFRVKEELLLVEGVEEEIYDEIKDLITIHGEGRVNINTCSEEILKALGMESNLANLVISFRKGEDGELNTADDGKFETNDGIASTLKEKLYLALRDEQALISFMSKNLLGVKSDNYRIKADVYVNDKPVDRYSVVFGKGKISSTFSVKEWSRH